MNLLGKYTYRIDDSYSPYVLKFITENRIPAEGVFSKAGYLYATLPFELKGPFEKELERLQAEKEIINISGPVKLLGHALRKKGILIGCLVSFIILNILSGIAFSFEVLTDDPEIKRDVLALLYQEGIRAGCSIRDKDLTAVERSLKQKVNGISWAGISVNGSKVVVDIVENDEKPEYTQRRLPTNLIARDSGVIEKVDIVDGQLMTTVGSGVTKGDIIVSGDVLGDLHYSRKGFVKHFYVHYYTRSIGKVYGTFERHETFFQPYTVTEKTVIGEPESKCFLSLFDVDIPLFFEAESNSIIGDYQEDRLSFFGVELPVALKYTDLTEYTFSEKPLSSLQAQARAEKLAEAYENNFLSELEIKSKDYTVETKPEGVYLKADYKLYGVISEEVEFFINK